MRIFIVIIFVFLSSCNFNDGIVYPDAYWNDKVVKNDEVISDEELPVFDGEENKPNKVNIIEE